MKTAFRIAWGAVRDGFYRWKHRNRVRVTAVDELPEKLKRQYLYLIGAQIPWSAALICPCGCGEVIHISLLSDDSPCWKLRLSAEKLPTLSPSVWRKQGCRSHFFLREGNIVWCRGKLN